MTVADAVIEVEAAGIAFRLVGEKVRVWYPDDKRRDNLADQIAFLRTNRADVASFLKARNSVPLMPPGVRLIEWKPKEPPVALETCAVVTDCGRFACLTIEDLRIALAEPRRWVGWSVPQLIERLAIVGVLVALETKGGAK